MSKPRRTPLYDFNVAHGGRMVDFAGWEMPVQFKSIVEEHKATRAAAGLFDVSHMGEAIVEGPQATEFLDFVLTNHIAPMERGRVLYSLMCNEAGGVVDDLLVYRKAEDSYLLCLNAANVAKDVAWLQERAADFEAVVTDVSDDYGLIALQGPKAFEVLAKVTEADLDSLHYYWFVEGEVCGAKCIISRTGYTGEKGVELFVSPSDAERVAETLLEVGEAEGLALAGLGARDSLRLEAGYSLYGHEIDDVVGPVAAKLMWTVKLKKDDFVGKAAIEKAKAAGPEKRIVFFKTGSRRIVRADAEVLANGEKVGHVVSGTFSPELNEAIGSALVDSDAAKADLSVDIRGKAMPLFAAKIPFLPLNPQA
ncbi:MAG: glycine cleavage system aminomethyltransferase GcvT [Verrucomicrobiota bacterium]